MSSTDVVNLIRQKEGLLRKLADFEVTNKALRKLLKEQSRYEVGALHPAYTQPASGCPGSIFEKSLYKCHAYWENSHVKLSTVTNFRASLLLV